jgi:hypothetical protein
MLKNIFIDSDREKNSASNVTIFNGSFTGIDGLSGQKLIFRSFLYAQNLPYDSTNIE